MKDKKMELEELKYDVGEIAFFMSVEPYVKQILMDEEIELITPYDLASICIGVYEMFRALLEEEVLLPEEQRDIGLFMRNYEYSIKETLHKTFQTKKETEELKNIIYC